MPVPKELVYYKTYCDDGRRRESQIPTAWACARGSDGASPAKTTGAGS